MSNNSQNIDPINAPKPDIFNKNTSQSNSNYNYNNQFNYNNRGGYRGSYRGGYRGRGSYRGRGGYRGRGNYRRPRGRGFYNRTNRGIPLYNRDYCDTCKWWGHFAHQCEWINSKYNELKNTYAKLAPDGKQQKQKGSVNNVSQFTTKHKPKSKRKPKHDKKDVDKSRFGH